MAEETKNEAVAAPLATIATLNQHEGKTGNPERMAL